MTVLRPLAVSLVLAAVAVPPASAQAPPVAPPPGPAYTADTPVNRQLYRTGPDGRFLVSGAWLFRLDPEDLGLRQSFARAPSTAGWTQIASAPNAWNAQDESEASMKGTVGWYRKDFRLPSASRRYSWVIRFESVNYRSRVWLNGRLLGTNKGAYLPFEFRLPPSVLRPNGVNRLVIRVDNRRYQTDFPPSGLNIKGVPTGGWWNYGGLLREVYLRRVDRVDFESVLVRPNLPCASCAANVEIRARMRNAASSTQRVRVRVRFGDRTVDLGSASLRPGRFAILRRSLRIGRPRLWSPASPHLYNVRFTARTSSGSRASYFLQSGIRSIKVSNAGRLLLNGRPLNFRGVGLHEDARDVGFAIDNAVRRRLVADARDLGATLLRSHYPLHPYMHELADQQGMLIWSEIPVYAIKTEFLKQRLVRQMAANELRDNILTNQNHPSVIVWSIANELSARPGPVQAAYIARAARTAHSLDPSRPVGLAVAGYPNFGCQAAYAPLDVIGINEYFGWYPGSTGQLADRTFLSGYLDSVRECYPNQAVVVSEFGAEANREGPVEEKGTFAFQRDFVNYHLGVLATKPWLSGAVYWALREFRVRPDWEGGNPRPHPPIHEKGLVTFDGGRKPAFFDVQRLFRATTQLRRG
jgi:beta-glucuronidase